MTKIRKFIIMITQFAKYKLTALTQYSKVSLIGSVLKFLFLTFAKITGINY